MPRLGRDRVVIPYRLAPDVVRELLGSGRPGAYALGRNEGGRFVVGYIGRSDRCLRLRLATHNRRSQFGYFIAKYADGPLEAFRIECELWHTYRDSGCLLANVRHPGTPRRSALECPYCHLAKHVRSLLRAA